MRSLLNTILLVGRIILPAILCSLLILIFIGGHKEYLVILTFGIFIILFNYGKIKYNFILSFLISILLSYAVFFLSILISGIIKYIFFMRGDIDKKVEGFILGFDINALLFLIPVAIISPLLMFYSYEIIFKIEKRSCFNKIKWLAILTLIVLHLLQIIFKEDYMYIYWQVVMTLALQLILYQEELRKLFSKKK